MGKVSNKAAGLKRAPTAYALYCANMAKLNLKHPITRRVQGKQPLNTKAAVLQHWSMPQSIFQAGSAHDITAADTEKTMSNLGEHRGRFFLL